MNAVYLSLSSARIPLDFICAGPMSKEMKAVDREMERKTAIHTEAHAHT